MRMNINDVKKIICLASGAALIACASAFAMDVSSAKDQNLVCEQADGYLKVVKPSPEVDNLVKETNAKRKEKYKEIASSTGATVEQVAARTAERAPGAKCP